MLMARVEVQALYRLKKAGEMAMERQDCLRRLQDDLDRLKSLPTAPEFLRRYWDLVLGHLKQCQHVSKRLMQFCEAVLAYELWHHKAMVKLAQSLEAQMRYVVLLGVELRASLLKLLRLLDGYHPISVEETVVWELLRAFCHYQLGNTEQVIRSLEAVWEHGLRSPLIAFALGYNRYRWALSKFARLEPTGRQLIVTEPDAFQKALRQAIADFDHGLALPCDAWMEAHLQFWKGTALTLLGEGHQAHACFERAKALAPDEYGEEVAEQPKKLLPLANASESRNLSLPAELLEERSQRVAPISEEELERWRKAVMEAETIADLLKRTSKEEPDEPRGN